MKARKVIIIGAGASGLFAAIHAAKAGADVTILEQNDKPGKKLAATGNGRCNLSNSLQESSCYHSDHPESIQKIFDRYSMKETLTFFEENGLFLKNRNGYWYPRTDQAASVIEFLVRMARQLHVKLKTNEIVTEIKCHSHTIEVVTKGWKYQADAVILSMGSRASQISGADGSGYQIAEALGHSLIEPLPALVPLKAKGNRYTAWKGVRTECRITLKIEQETMKESGEIQLTEYGISGIPVFQISRHAVRALARQTQVLAFLNFLPEKSAEEGYEFLMNRKEMFSDLSMKDFLNGIFPDKLVTVLLKEKDPLRAAVAYPLEIQGHGSERQAQVLQGGVPLSEINSDTMESRKQKGIYITGELLDVDGICGGYNLQWAWSTGAIAGQSAAKDKV